MTDRLWYVTVQCWYESETRFCSIKRAIEVEAPNSEAAKKAAIDYCDSTAHSSKKWTRFEFIRLRSVEYPKYPREALIALD